MCDDKVAKAKELLGEAEEGVATGGLHKVSPGRGHAAALVRPGECFHRAVSRELSFQGTCTGADASRHCFARDSGAAKMIYELLEARKNVLSVPLHNPTPVVLYLAGLRLCSSPACTR